VTGYHERGGWEVIDVGNDGAGGLQARRGRAVDLTFVWARCIVPAAGRPEVRSGPHRASSLKACHEVDVGGSEGNAVSVATPSHGAPKQPDTPSDVIRGIR
jgi:hypothetical protein